MDKSKIAEGLSEVFGDKTVRVIMPKQFLSNLESILSKQNKELADQVRANNISTELLGAQKETQKLLIELAKAIKENKVKAVEVSNFPAPQPFPEIPEPKEIKFPEIPPYPTHINLIEPKWYQKAQTKFVDFLTDKFQAIKKSFAEDLDSHMDREKALAVRLVDAEGKTFYNAMFYGGGGGGVTFGGLSTNTGVNGSTVLRIVQAYNSDWLTFRARYTAAQTDVALVTAGASEKIVVKKIAIMADHANTVDVGAYAGFGSANTPTTTGLISHPGIAAGSGESEYFGSDGVTSQTAGDDLRMTSEAPTGGNLDVIVVYKII